MTISAAWKPEETRTLQRLWDYSWSGVTAIAAATGRSNSGVWTKASKLGYRLRHDKGEWSEDDEKALVCLWNEQQKTANEISEILGKSRNSIIGKARRMKLDARTSPIKIRPGNRAGRPKKEVAAKRRRVEIAGNNVHFLDLGKGQCRFPMWGDEAPTHIYCGCDTEGHRNYCPAHKALVIRKTISAEDLAKREEARVNSFKRQKFVFG